MTGVSLLLSIAILLSACSAGTDFKRPDPATFVLGKTTEQQIRQQYGAPRGQGSMLANGKPVNTLSYAYAEAAPYVQKVASRALVFSFSQGMLVGYSYSSSFSSDKTDFDEVRSVAEIKKGETSRTQVSDLLGVPTGEYIYPLVKAPDGRAYVYSYYRMDKNQIGPTKFHVQRKVLVVEMDGSGIVSEVTMNASASD